MSFVYKKIKCITPDNCIETQLKYYNNQIIEGSDWNMFGCIKASKVFTFHWHMLEEIQLAMSPQDLKLLQREFYWILYCRPCQPTTLMKKPTINVYCSNSGPVTALYEFLFLFLHSYHNTLIGFFFHSFLLSSLFSLLFLVWIIAVFKHFKKKCIYFAPFYSTVLLLLSCSFHHWLSWTIFKLFHSLPL